MKKQDINRFIEHNLKNFSVNSTGWNDLIGEMLCEMATAGWDMKHDVFGKEKFGELRCYMYSENEELNIALKKITDKYSKLSRKVCEICGNEGKMRMINSWQTTLCMNHFLDQNPLMEIDENLNIQYKNKKILNLKEVVKAEVEFDLQTLNLYTEETAHKDESFCFSWQEPNYYLLLRIVPLHLFHNDMQSSISDLFQNLKYCDICGYKALHHNTCLRCYNKPWGTCEYHEKDYGEKSNYIKECQMDIFMDEEGYEEYFKYDCSFEKNTDHEILFTPGDLEEYEKLLF